ncbi:hypothetical protein C1H46_045792 [Malus baccata]|uniref:Uncharacterized protein n=1 Tax=Malus baccata TaxID=106549 RepID=A0A540K341_MALBA|nr:hypothetical protein C1H46_045792 [Malus baccata]
MALHVSPTSPEIVNSGTFTLQVIISKFKLYTKPKESKLGSSRKRKTKEQLEKCKKLQLT